MSSRHDPVAPHPHPRPTLERLFVRLGTLALLGSGLGCGKHVRQVFFNENLLPLLSVSSVTVDTSRAVPDVWRAQVQWAAADSDGVVLSVEYAVDASDGDTAWVASGENPIVLTFPVRARNASGYLVPERRLLTLRARDNRGEWSPREVVAMFAGNEPPSLRIVRPGFVPTGPVSVPGSFTLDFDARDPDGFPSMMPSQLYVRTVLAGTPLFADVALDPDTLIRIGEQSGWAEWVELRGDSPNATLDGFVNGQTGLVCAVAFDAAGDHTRSAALGTNLLVFTVSPNGPSTTVQGDGFTARFDPNTPASTPNLFRTATTANTPHTMACSATPPTGCRIASHRWVLDPIDVNADTQRTGANDVRHWSAPTSGPSLNADLPPLTAGLHQFIVEATDDQGRRTRFTIELTAVGAVFEQELLIVDDTRREPDRTSGVCTQRLTRPWPSSAELDTFLYARGDVPWRCALTGTGVVTPSGLFAGYSFDTTGTRRGLEDPVGSISLGLLATYRHVVWLVDAIGAQYNDNLDQSQFPVTALYKMGQPGHVDLLRSYVAMGGDLWLAGGGAANASLSPTDVRSNNTAGGGKVFSAALGELTTERLLGGPGHLRSEITANTFNAPALIRSPAARGGWSGHGMDATLAAPDYSRLPTQLRLRTPELDPLPPSRLAGQADLYYGRVVPVEYVSAPNVIVEDLDPDPGVVRNESVLDTLIECVSPTVGSAPAPTMTYYHGREHGTFVFSGFALWDWTRSDAQTLVDFVLQEVWGLSRTGPAARRGSALTTRSAPPRYVGARPPVPARLQRDPGNNNHP